MTDEPKSYTNGIPPCRISLNEWDDWKDSMEKINIMHTNTDCLPTIDSSLKEIKKGLFTALFGNDPTKGIMPVTVATQMLQEQRKAYLSIIKTMSAVFVAFTLALIGAVKFLTPHLLG